MAAPRIDSFYYPTKEELLDLYLRRIRVRAELRGLTVNVAVGSENWLRGDALASVCAHAFANNKIALQQYSPLTAQGDKLLELAAEFGVEPRPGAKSLGSVTARCTGTITIPDGYLATGANGEKYEAVGPVTISSSGTVTVRAVNAGTAGNQSANAILTWDDAALGFLLREARVSVGGITGGTEDDTWQEVQARLLKKLRASPVGSNWAQVREWALDATSSVAEAYVYAAMRGPSSFDVCIVGENGEALSTAVCDEVEAYLLSQVGDHVSLNVTSVVDDSVDAVFSLLLPAASSDAGGWVDSTPWPRSAVTVTTQAGAVLTTSLAYSSNRPADGNHLYIHDGVGLQGPFVVDSTVNSGGFLQITLTSAPSGDVEDCYLSAAAESLADYIGAVGVAFLALGPGEKTSSTYLLPRARRRPTVDSGGAQMRAGHRIESALHDAFDEVEQAQLVSVFTTGTTTAHASPSLPALTGDAPKRLKLARLGFYDGAT